MERLTYRDARGEAWYADSGTEADHLHFIADIEDILGDNYDLDRLREIVEADRDGLCVVLPCKPGDILRHKGHDCEADHWNIVLTAFSKSKYTKSGKNIHLLSVQEAAEAALKGERDDIQEI